MQMMRSPFPQFAQEGSEASAVMSRPITAKSPFSSSRMSGQPAVFMHSFVSWRSPIRRMILIPCVRNNRDVFGQLGFIRDCADEAEQGVRRFQSESCAAVT